MNVEFVYNGNYHDENLRNEISLLKAKISGMVQSECYVAKVEPWNSVKVTFSIPKEAVAKLKQLAAKDSVQLKELGILSLQIEGEDIIKLSLDDGEGHPQELTLHQQAISQQQNDAAMRGHMFNPPIMNINQQGPGTPLAQPMTPAPKKRNRKPKNKNPALNKNNQIKTSPQSKPHDQFSRPNTLQTNDMAAHQNPNFHITQLSPSVEQMVSEAWDQELHHQNPEEDIMGVQLQSLTSEPNVTTASNQINNPNATSTFEQPHQHMMPKHMPPGISPSPQPLTFAPSNMLMQMRPELQKQQSVPSNFAPQKMSADNKVFPAPNMGIPATNHVSQLPQQRQARFNQVNTPGTMDQDISHTSTINNMPNNFQATNLQTSSANLQPHNLPSNNWPQGSMLQQQSNSYKMLNNTVQPNNFPMQTNSSEPPSGVPGMQTTMPSPGSSAHTGQFPFSFPNAAKGQPNMGEMRPDKLAAMGQGMSMDSPLLVTLLQNEAAAAAAGMPGVSNPAQVPFSSVPLPSPIEKPKRKKQTRKKKAKSSAPTTPTGSVPTQAFSGVYGMPAQFASQRFPHGDMPGQEQVMQHQNPMMKMNYQDPKVSVIETISRSDVGAQAVPFSGNMAISSANGNVRPNMQQMPMYRRHNSVPGNQFPQGFDNSKPNFIQQKQLSNMSSQPQMMMNQMTGQYAHFDPNQSPRPMMVQQMQFQQMMQPNASGSKNPAQFQQGNFQHAMGQRPMMQPGPNRPQQVPCNSEAMVGSQQGANPDSFPLPMSQPGADLRHPGTLPTLPQTQQRPAMPHHRGMPMMGGRKRRRTSSAGRLSSGNMSIMLKSPCSMNHPSKITPAQLPTLPLTALHSRSNSQSVPLKSPASSSIDSMSFGSPSPKLGHPNTPSPHMQNVQMMRSPSPLTPHGSRSGTPKPRQATRTSSNSAKPSVLARRPSLDQFAAGSPVQGGANRGFGSSPSTPTGPASLMHFKAPEPALKTEGMSLVGENVQAPSRSWPTPGMSPFPWQQGQNLPHSTVNTHAYHGFPLNSNEAKRPKLTPDALKSKVSRQLSGPQVQLNRESPITTPKVSETNEVPTPAELPKVEPIKDATDISEAKTAVAKSSD